MEAVETLVDWFISILVIALAMIGVMVFMLAYLVTMAGILIISGIHGIFGKENGKRWHHRN